MKPKSELIGRLPALIVGLLILLIVIWLLCSAAPARAAGARAAGAVPEARAANPALARARTLLDGADYPGLLRACAEAAAFPGADAAEVREAFVLGAIAHLVLGDEPHARTAARMAIALGGDVALAVPAGAPPRALVFFDAVRARGPAPVLWVGLRAGEGGAPRAVLTDTEGLVARVNLYVRAPGSDTYELRTWEVGTRAEAAAGTDLPGRVEEEDLLRGAGGGAGAFEYFLVAEMMGTRVAVAGEGSAEAPASWPRLPGSGLTATSSETAAATLPALAAPRPRATSLWWRHPSVWGAILGAVGVSILVIVAAEVMPAPGP